MGGLLRYPDPMGLHMAVTNEQDGEEWVCTCLCGEAFTGATREEAATLHSTHMLQPRAQ